MVEKKPNPARTTEPEPRFCKEPNRTRTPKFFLNQQVSEILGSLPISTEQENARDQKHLTYGEDESWNRCESIVVDECDGIGQMTFTSTNECQSMPFVTNTRGGCYTQDGPAYNHLGQLYAGPPYK